VSHDLPPSTLLFPSTTGTGALGDIFGGSVDVPLLLKKKNAKIDTFFMVETAEAKAERNTWDFKGIATDKEQQDFHDALSLTRRNTSQWQVDREHQTKHRDKIRAQKIADGWQPYQKRVS
jgi:hypothetical protein